MSARPAYRTSPATRAPRAGADHLLTRHAAAEFVAQIVAAWAARTYPRFGHTVRRHSCDCGDCVSTDGQVDWVRREIVFDGPLDDMQRSRLHGLRFAHRSLRRWVTWWPTRAARILVISLLVISPEPGTVHTTTARAQALITDDSDSDVGAGPLTGFAGWGSL